MTKRDIKFRAYTEKYGLVDVRRVANTTLDVFDVELENGITILAGSKRAPDVTLEQYTGLKDADGVEIYEGDIMQFYSGRIGVVGFDRGMYMIAHGLYGTAVSYASRKHNAVVVGNVHEHPELLEV